MEMGWKKPTQNDPITKTLRVKIGDTIILKR
jgi:hypothetical protein